MSIIRHLDITLPTPQENLALEEALLDAVEKNNAPPTLRFWESTTPFVVLGTAQQWQQEAIEENCIQDNIPIMRRCSAGGAVLQGPGCLNYTLVLPYTHFPELNGITASYKHLLGKIITACNPLGITLAHSGISDLTHNGLKISGNAQRRKKHTLLHHGTLLYQPNIDGMTRYLREPQDRPDYRSNKTHHHFVGDIPLTPATLKKIIANTFDAAPTPTPPKDQERTHAKDLANQKYNFSDWIKRR